MKYATLFIAGILSLLAGTAQVRVGAEQTERLMPLLKGKRVSLVVNQTSLCGGVHLLDTLYDSGTNIVQVFVPEHGFRGNADAGENISNGKDARTGLPILSLYGKNKKPRPSQLERTDVVVFDLQDVGARFYTYISTLYYVMQACAEQGKELIVLDRPNPCDYVDGPVLQPEYKSFVGMLPLPVLHGCTVGELAQMINGEGWLGGGRHCPLTVVAARGWKHGQPYPLPVKPSPNLPNDRAVSLYPSLCPFEGTSVSVGRGTQFPFQQIGSPLLSLSGYRFKPRALPGMDKNPLHKDQWCYGISLRKGDKPEGFSLKYVLLMYGRYCSEIGSRPGANPQKAFFTRPRWFDLLMGTSQVRLDILQGKTEKEIRQAWKEDLARYREMRKKYLIYEE